MSKKKLNPLMGRVPITQIKTTSSDGEKAKVPHKPTSSGSDKGGKK